MWNASNEKERNEVDVTGYRLNGKILYIANISSKNIILCIIYLRVVRKVGAGIPNSIQAKCVCVCVCGRCLLWKNIFRFLYNFLYRFISFRLLALFWSTLTRVRQSVFCSSAFDFFVAFCCWFGFGLSFDPSAIRFTFVIVILFCINCSADTTFFIYFFIQQWI